jgi:CRP-like cAMP-binding protein
MIKTVYFPLSGVVSVVVDLATGEMIESAMIGRDSLVGGSAAFDNPISLNRVVVQVAGAASALNVDRFRDLAQQSESFRAKPARHEHFLLAQAQLATQLIRSKKGYPAGCSGAAICSTAMIFRLLRSSWPRCLVRGGPVSRS